MVAEPRAQQQQTKTTRHGTPFPPTHLWIEQQVLRLDIAMADAEGVDVRQSPGELVEVQLHQENRQRLLALVVRPRHAVHRLRYELQDQVKVQLVRLDGYVSWWFGAMVPGREDEASKPGEDGAHSNKKRGLGGGGNYFRFQRNFRFFGGTCVCGREKIEPAVGDTR